MWDSRVMKHGLRLGFNGQFDDFDDFDDKGRSVLITAAAPSYEVEHRTRVRKYLTLMAFRVPALILAAIAYGAWHNGLISLLIVAASVPLPWMAVLIANDRPPRRADEPRRFDVARRRIPLFPTAERPALEPRRQPAERSAPGIRRPRLAVCWPAFRVVGHWPHFSGLSQVFGRFLHVTGRQITAGWELKVRLCR